MKPDHSNNLTPNEQMRLMLDKAKDIRAQRIREFEGALAEKDREREGIREGLKWWKAAIPFDVLNEDATINARNEQRKQKEEDAARRQAQDEALKVHELKQQASFRVAAWIFVAMLPAWIIAPFLTNEFIAGKTALGFVLSILVAFIAALTV